MKKGIEGIETKNYRIGELRELFAKYKIMYQIPGVPIEVVEENFEKYYLSSVKHFDEDEIINSDRMGSRIILQSNVDDLTQASNTQNESTFRNMLQNFSPNSIMFFVRDKIDSWTSEEVVEFVIRNILKHTNDDLIIREVIKRISLLRDKDLRKRVLLDIMQTDHITIKANALQKLYTIIFPDTVRQFSREDALNIIRESLNDQSIYLRVNAVKALVYFLDRDFDFKPYEHLLRNQNEHPSVKLALLRLKLKHYDEYMLSLLNGDSIKNRNETVKQIIELSEVYNEELYSDHFDFEKLRMRKWKTGGKMETLGDRFLGKMITKYIPLDGFLAWRKLYENPQIWKEAGLNYVPIEPIISFKSDKGFPGLVKVQTGALGMTVQAHEDLNSGGFLRFIENRMSVIKGVVESNDVTYDCGVGNHWRADNFCLYWEKLGSFNKIDWTKYPRVYLIDFDHAKNM